MDTAEQLDSDISDLHTRIATLHAHRANLASVLLSQPHLAARLAHGSSSDQLPKRVIEQQSRRNIENIYRACAGVTAYKVKDPDPHAVNNGNVLGVSIDVSISGKFVETYHVLFTFQQSDGAKVLKIHRHTVPTCIPLQQLAHKWIPVGSKDAESIKEPEQDLVRFGRSLRKELVSWHMRTRAVEVLRKEAGLPDAKPSKDNGHASFTSTGNILNAFVSDDDNSDAEEDVTADASLRITDLESDAAVRQITVTWSDGRTGVMGITKDGRVDKAICRTRGGGRDAALSRKAIGPIRGLVRRSMTQ
ncbi:hypothetical protein P153DRAFT_364444 [Dothidotthia symphoricarpi CBS 119687]|uniref:Cenp-O kinetochore centromere component n=1 Tax=Dothidotthia symphoricarpi CBS 119687 TaxID=1392245 RepID=A0A6A6ALB6_9PLEO|nr:uncharacterized protein P153DRAFT_364444 [Dothidotthia symphoricarpi CBS 119687]KAF2131983.1 hypothetical protein P153DRAFT_364444 [Dothidotthia symphoricarpi CBS 119687]